MNREKAIPVVLALVCVFALAFAAATLVEPHEPGGGGSSIVTPNDDTATDRNGEDGTSPARPLTDPGRIVFSMSFCIPFLLSGEFFAIVVVLTAAIWLYVQHSKDGLAATGLVGTIAFPGFFLWLLLTNCATQNEPDQLSVIPSTVAEQTEGVSSSLGLSQNPGNVSPEVALLIAALVVGIVLVFAWFALRGDDEDRENDEEVYEAGLASRSPRHRMAAIGAAAGRAADRLETSTAVDNEVYRAWREMTRHLDVPEPESSTPAEFAEAAIAAGMTRDQVTELTALFEEVRYGGEDPTTDRESRAIEALRAIESAHASGAKPTADDDD
ncbi:DUF4129 domain-containing protein [Haloarchaeobius sp. DYHT-AS-18]|uniref:DUF4129 domain-containing protein n=1 Tax=Haloarchaeobius sp. DYHT-AS-18 TaxID=3446117 RepID=UPI003EB79098